MPSLRTPFKIATKGAELGFQIGSFVAGQAYGRVQSLVGGKDDQDRYGPATPAAPAGQAAPASPPRLESVPTPTTAKTTATGPGGRGRTAPPAPKTAKAKEITAKPTTGGSKGETDTTVKAVPRTGPRSAGGRISNPKAARKARARAAGAAPKAGAGAGAGQKPGTPTAAARTSDLSKAKGKGGRPATVKAENSPTELAAAKKGKQPAPLGSDA